MAAACEQSQSPLTLHSRVCRGRVRILTRNSRRNSLVTWLQMQGAHVPPILTALKHQSKVRCVSLCIGSSVGAASDFV